MHWDPVQLANTPLLYHVPMPRLVGAWTNLRGVVMGVTN